MDLECIILIEVIQSHKKKTLHVPLHLQNLINNICMYVCMQINVHLGFAYHVKK